MPVNLSTSRLKFAPPVAFKPLREQRILLEALQRARGHETLSDTLREAVAEYLQRHVGPLVGAGVVLGEAGEDAADDRADVLHEPTVTRSV